MITLPEAFEQEMKQLLGEEEYEAYRKTFDEAVHRGLRVNNGKISTEEFLRRTDIPLKKVPWIPNGFYYDEESCNPAKDADYYAGLYYLQEPSAMTPASRLPIEPDDRVLDLCAAPGGKATELGSRIGEGGMLLANDISNSRAKALLRNLEIQGVGRLLVTSEDPEKLVALYPAFFDKILLDAPCSGEGMFRKESSMLRYYSENGPEHYVPIQKKLIEQAYQMLAEGGELLYSTCTFSVKENEEVIAGLLDAHPDMEVQEITPGYEGFAPGVSVNGPRSFPVRSCFPAADGGRRPFRGAPEKAGREPETAAVPTFGNDKEAAERGGRVSCWRAHGLEEWVVCPCERPALFSAGRCLCGKGSALSADRTFAWHRKEKPLRAVPGAGGVSEKRRIRFVFDHSQGR